MSHLVARARLLPIARALLAAVLVGSSTTAWAHCYPPQDSLDWIFVGEIVQNLRVVSTSRRAVSSWSTVDSMANRLSTSIRHTLSASQSENVSVSARIAFFNIAYSSSSTTQHQVEVSIPANTRARLMRQRREELIDYMWDVVCAWRHRTTGASAITSYGRNYSGTTWRLYDAFEVRTERI